ncbi:MAG: FixH family protein [Pseudomonadota bacterium]
MITELKGWHVLAMFGSAFGIIIAVNVTLALNAVASFPGLEVKNSYVASQSFDRDRRAQQALDWEVDAWLQDDLLILRITRDGAPVQAKFEQALLGRPTSVKADQALMFDFDGAVYVAPVTAGPGNWNLRLKARAPDGTLFSRRIVLRPTQ